MTDSSFIPVDSNILPDIRTGTPAVMYGSKVVVAGIGGNYIPNQISGVVTSDGNIHNNNVLSGYIGYNSSGKVVGAIPVISGGTHYVDSTGYTLSSGCYLSGDQVFIGAGSGGLDIDITLGVAVDGGASGVLFQQLSFSGTSASDHGSAVDVASSYRTWNTGHPAPSPIISDGNITQDTVLSGYSGYNSSGIVSGTIPSIAGSTYTVGSQGYTLSAGQYLGGDQIFTASAGGGGGKGTFQGTGRVLISSGATLDNLSITGPSCHVVTYAGGTANNVTVNSGAFLHISSGGLAMSATVNTSGTLYLSSGGMASDTIINGGSATIQSDAAATGTTVNSGGMIRVTGGTATGTTVNSSGMVLVSSAGIANSTTVSGGVLAIYGGTAADTDMKSGVLNAYSGGVFSGTTISGGYLFASVGSALDTTVVSRGYLIFKNAYASGTTVSSGGSVYISSDGTATDTTVSSGGSVYISSGGTATSTTVNFRGYLRISGGKASSVTVQSSGGLEMYNSGSLAEYVTLSSGGSLYISSGCSATHVVSQAGAIVSSADGAYIQYDN